MWTFAPRGFISVVAYDPSKDRNSKSEFRNIAKKAGTHVLIRARIEADLDMLKEVVPNLLIETDPAADYSYRCVMTRKQYKRFLVRTVDEIDYDSHFKEVVRDRSPQVEGRYSAMMTVWSAFAKLQPLSPYGGWGGYGDYGYSGYSSSSKSKSTTKATGSKIANPKALPAGRTSATATANGYDTMEEYLRERAELGHKPPTGWGPRTGFKEGDVVEGHFGTGEVIKVEDRKSTLNGADMVKVRFRRPNEVKDTESVFVSNYLHPLSDVEADPNLKDSIDLESVYNRMLTMDTHVFPADELQYLTFDALEFTIRVHERGEDGVEITKDVLEKIRDEVFWEMASDEERLKRANEGDVPEKYAGEIANLSIQTG